MQYTMVIFTHNVKDAKGVAHKNGAIYCTCKLALILLSIYLRLMGHYRAKLL